MTFVEEEYTATEGKNV